MVRSAVIDEELELGFLRVLARRLKSAPLRLLEGRLAVPRAELAIRVKALRTLRTITATNSA
jgi:hypothetical protein